MEDIHWGEGLTLGEARDAAFLFTGWGTWVGKPTYLATDPMTIKEGQWVIAQAVTNHWVKTRGLGHPHINLPTQQPFRFDCPRDSPRKDTPGDASYNHQPLPHQPLRGMDHNRCWRDHRQPPPWLPSPSLDCRFESDRSSLSMASLMSSMSDRSDCTLLPYAIQSLQGYPGELVWSSGTELTLDDVLIFWMNTNIM